MLLVNFYCAVMIFSEFKYTPVFCKPFGRKNCNSPIGQFKLPYLFQNVILKTDKGKLPFSDPYCGIEIKPVTLLIIDYFNIYRFEIIVFFKMSGSNCKTGSHQIIIVSVYCFNYLVNISDRLQIIILEVIVNRIICIKARFGKDFPAPVLPISGHACIF